MFKITYLLVTIDLSVFALNLITNKTLCNVLFVNKPIKHLSIVYIYLLPLQ